MQRLQKKFSKEIFELLKVPKEPVFEEGDSTVNME